jgi:hypothetical protein
VQGTFVFDLSVIALSRYGFASRDLREFPESRIFRVEKFSPSSKIARGAINPDGKSRKLAESAAGCAPHRVGPILSTSPP